VIIRPGSVGELASVKWRPVSAALKLENRLLTSGPQSDNTLKLNPVLPQCIGQPNCVAEITGELPVDFVPPLTGKYPLVQTVRIVQPSNYARTVLIEALRKEGVRIDGPVTAENPVALLPPAHSYRHERKLAELKGMPYSEDAKFILKVSYNIGADTSLVLFGLTQGVDNLDDALTLERDNLRRNYGIPAHEFHFVDGSGGGETTATNRAVTHMLEELAQRPTFPVFFNALPALAVDGTLASVTDFEADPTLAGAKGQVRAKTGTYVGEFNSGLLLKGQSYGGYIHTKNGKHLVYELVVNNVPITSVADVFKIFEDQGTISAMLWRDN
jgi:D-alanyl-D-alanine carboxypeptidase